MSESEQKKLAFGLETSQVRAGIKRTCFNEMSEPIFMTSGFVYDSAEQAAARFAGEDPGYIYSRYGNPTLRVFEERLAAIEGAERCHGTASGMAAIFATIISLLRTGDHFISSRAVFGSCHVIANEILPRYGIETTMVDGNDLDAWEKAFRSNTKAVFIETPANPTLDIIDIQAVADLTHSNGARLIIDNAFASPAGQKPLQFGADIVIYSATKHIDGQGRCLGGAVLGSAEFCDDEFMLYYRHTGPALSPFNAWILLKGLETLSIRVERQASTAAMLSEFLSTYREIHSVRYPWLPSHPNYEIAKRQMQNGGTLISFDLKTKATAFAFMNALQIINISNNLGDTRSMATHPFTTTHRAMDEDARRTMGITEGLVRLSIGLETPADLLGDIKQALYKTFNT